MMETEQQPLVGIAIRGSVAEVYSSPPGKGYRQDLAGDGLLRLARSLHELQPERILMPAREGLETEVASAFADSGLPVVLLHWAQVLGRTVEMEVAQGAHLEDAERLVLFGRLLLEEKVENPHLIETDELLEYARGRAAQRAEKQAAGAGGRSERKDPVDETGSVKLISTRHRFVWVAVPGVAEKPLMEALYHNPPEEIEGELVHEELWSLHNRRPELTGFFTFAFVRNPWARAVSTWADITAKDRPEDVQRIIKSHPEIRQGMSFEEFVRFLADHQDGGDEGANPQWMSQHRFLTDRSGRVIVDHIGKLEHFEEDWDTICGRIGLDDFEPPDLIPQAGTGSETEARSGATGHGDYREYYTGELRSLVAGRYRRDIELFGYSF